MKVNGHHYASSPVPLREIGALLEAHAVHPGRSARDHLRWLAASNGIPTTRVGEVLELVGLDSVAGQRAGRFSLGMGQRLGIAAAMLGDPSVLVLDEPVNGLDPEGIRWVRTFARQLADEGRTVFVSSHLMTEMALMADHLIVIGQGSILADCSMQEFMADHARSFVRVKTGDVGAAAEILASNGLDVGRHHGASGPELHVQGLDAAAHRRAARAARRPAARADAGELVARGRLHDPHRRQRGVLRARSGPPGSRSSMSTLVHGRHQLAQPGFAAALRSERIKLTSIRSTWWTLASLLVIGVGGTVLLCALNAEWLASPEADEAPGSFITGGLMLSPVCAVILGTLAVSSEYGTGMMRSTLAATPVRGRVLVAKAVVVAAILFVVGTVTALLGYVGGNYFLDREGIGLALEGDVARSMYGVRPVHGRARSAVGRRRRSSCGTPRWRCRSCSPSSSC